MSFLVDVILPLTEKHDIFPKRNLDNPHSKYYAIKQNIVPLKSLHDVSFFSKVYTKCRFFCS